MATETVTLKLPSGEMVDAIVPAGLDDAGIKSLMRMKHPDVFGPPAGAAGPHVRMEEQNLLDPSNAGAASSGVAPAGKLTGLPGVNPHVPSYREGVSDVSLAGAPLLAAGPVSTALKAVAGATVGATVAKTGAAALGAGKTGQELAETAGGIVGGGIGSQARIPETVKAGVGPVAKAVVRTVDTATFNRASAIWNAWKDLPAEIRMKVAGPDVNPGAPLPATPAPEVLQASALQQGGKPVVDPAQALSKIPVNNPPPEPVAAGFSKVAVSKKLDTALNDATGGKPLQPGVRLRDQGRPLGVPEGYTPVTESSAVKAYKYDPAANELHVTTKDGITYVAGEVTSAQAEAFASADSKGKAWQAIRQNTTPVAKIINGKRISLKPSIRSASPSDAPSDLQEKLEQSLAQALQQKAGR